jgi:ferritin-like metal-binding protein YciE
VLCREAAVATLPKLAKNSWSAELEKAFNDHREQTEGHVKRLEQVFDMIGKKPRGKKCDAIGRTAPGGAHFPSFGSVRVGE